LRQAEFQGRPLHERHCEPSGNSRGGIDVMKSLIIAADKFIAFKACRQRLPIYLFASVTGRTKSFCRLQVEARCAPLKSASTP